VLSCFPLQCAALWVLECKDVSREERCWEAAKQHEIEEEEKQLEDIRMRIVSR
jgi:hypothetical protein